MVIIIIIIIIIITIIIIINIIKVNSTIILLSQLTDRMYGSTCGSPVFKDIRERNSFLAVRNANRRRPANSIANERFVMNSVYTSVCVSTTGSALIKYFVTAVNRQICFICYHQYRTTHTLSKPHVPIDTSQGQTKPPVPSPFS